MHRRDVLKGIAATSTVSLWPRFAGAAGPSRFIDAHCHVFNANDLPVRPFVEKVMLPDLLTALERKRTSKFFLNLLRKNKKAEMLVVDVLYRLMLKVTPTLAAENDEIAQHGTLLKQEQILLRRRKIEIDALNAILREIWDPDKLQHEFRKIPESSYFGPTALEEIRARIRREAIILMTNEEYYRSWDTDFQELPTFAQRLYDSERPPYGEKPIGYMMRWALRFTRHRFELADELANMHGDKLVLMTPAMVDFDLWLSKSNRMSEYNKRLEQLAYIDTMAAISRRPKGPRVHGFVCFDPLRQAVFSQQEKNHQSLGKSPLKIVEDAVGKGFVGVKLYPPMGFRPALNRNIDNVPGKYPDWIRTGPERLQPTPGVALDAALDALFVWCRDNNVPVMAHANNSNEAGPYYGARGSPDNWKTLLKSKRADGTDFLNLRINLGHFGGFEEAVYNPIGDEKLQETWEWKVLQIWKEMPQAKLYADISYLNEILAPPAESSDDAKQAYQDTLRKTREFWKKRVVTEPLAKERLMYGTDWIMTGGEAGFPSYMPQNPQPDTFYPDLVAAFLESVGFGDHIDRIMFTNAVEFLGLKQDASEKSNRARLAKFHEANADWLKIFD